MIQLNRQGQVIIVILFILLSTLYPQQIQGSSFISFKSYQIEDGLSHNTVWCSIQDSYGFIWFGTSDGLNCYNGQENKVYKNELNNPFSIENNYIQSLFELEDHNILVGTNSGLYLYERDTERFTYFDVQTEYGVTISSSIKKIIRSRNGLLWITTMGQGFFVYDPSTRQLKQNSLYTTFVCDICQDQSGDIYIASLQQGLFCFNEEGVLLESYRLKPGMIDNDDYKINCLFALGEDVWVGMASNQILRFNKEEKAKEHFTVSTSGVENVQCIMEYDSTRILVGSDDGLYLFDYKNKSAERLDDPLGIERMSDQTVNAMMKDAEGGIWILTNLGGANYIAKSTKQFYHFASNNAKEAIGSGKVIGPFCEDASGTIWIGTRRGLCSFNKESKKVLYHPMDGTIDKKHYDVRSLMMDDDQMWIGTSGNGLFVMNMLTRKVKRYVHSQDMPNSICGDDVLSVYKTKNGDIYVGTSWGLCRYDRNHDNFIIVIAVGMMVSVVDIYEDMYGYLWIGTSNSGVFRLNISNGEWKHFHHIAGDSSSIISNSIITLFEDSRGTMWFGTDGRGLCSFDRETESFIDFDPGNNLISNKVIYAIEEDTGGDFWISNNAGLVRVNPMSKRNPRKFTVNDGLQSNQFNFRSSLKSSDGYLFFGGINGFNIFAPRTFTDNTYIPPVYITDINFPHLDEHLTKRDILQFDAPVYMVPQIAIPYQHNSFSLNFASLSYEAPTNNRYSYILHGIDKDWIHDTEVSTAFYTDLPPGEYKFEVRGSNNDGVWNDKSATLTIIIIPPWWRSTIAYLIYIAFILGLVAYLAWRWNKYIKLKYKRRMEDFQAVKEKEIYESKINFFINLVHEIRTPLSLIKLPLEKLQEESDSKYLSVIDKNVNYLLGITNQLLDFQKMESGMYNQNLNKCNVKQLTEYICQQFIASAELKGIALTFQLPEEDVVTVTDRDKISKILVNLISNAIKYARSRIEVKLYLSGEVFGIVVSDDGPGIPLPERDKIFEPFYQVQDRKSAQAGTGIGLAFSKNLVESLNGALSMEDNAWGGSTFVLSLPVGNVEDIQKETMISEELIRDISEEGETEHFDLQKRKFTVLLVEDNIDLLNLTSESLNEWFHILKAHNGKEALEILSGESPDVIVSDIMMPDMDGLELCSRIKEDILYSHIPIVLLTAKTNIEAKTEAFECGADAYVEKPFSIKQLRGQIENLLKLRLAYHRVMINLSGENKVELQGVVSQKDRELMIEIKQAVEEQLSDENFSVDSLAEILNMSRSSFYRKIKALTGMPPNDYLKVIRLNKAAELLKQGMGISEVYEKVGFSSSSYFAKCFKTQFGMLPKEYVDQK
ncbi:two-component regulator propeller domain-containing protein [Bacteroides sp. 51]|uniref:hybrid sensor histidine kinase/response regulator transcription factor n=1 Tax=Bacteroides sp. 51 TaxID=2302938 RepID=UPI0013D3372E|nr:two-component regulator propeller domain-containing protein [Bacteroides sp. 51]NDV82824.1 response regulator [Bacteroides sp. 51]